jgi:hypothetical protein
MPIPVSDAVVGLLMIAFGLLGLLLAARAIDAEMYVFGVSLTGFAAAFVAGQIRRVCDEADTARVVVHD